MLGPAMEDVLDSVKTLGEATIRDLADDTGRSLGCVRDIVRRLVRRGLVVRDGMVVHVPGPGYAPIPTGRGRTQATVSAALDALGTTTVPALAEHTGLSECAVRHAVRRMRLVGLVERNGRAISHGLGPVAEAEGSLGGVQRSILSILSEIGASTSQGLALILDLAEANVRQSTRALAARGIIESMGMSGGQPRPVWRIRSG